MNNDQKHKNVINIETYFANIKEKISEILKNSTYSELTKYIAALPKIHANDEELFYWGFSYLNEYYKLIGKLDKKNGIEIEELKYKIYVLYLQENHYNSTVFSYNEFITFSRLLNVSFPNYNSNKTRKNDKKVYQSGDTKIDDIIYKLAKDVFHSPHPHAYEITSVSFKVLLNTLNEKKESLLQEEFEKINLNDPLLTKNISKDRINNLQKLQKKQL